MKKILKFAFAIVAMACVVFASASCGKDDDSHITQEMWYNSHDPGDPFFPHNENKAQEPRFVDEESFWGYVFDVKWTAVHYIDTTQFEYELFWKGKGDEEYKSLGRQKDTIFHFDLNKMNLDIIPEESYKIELRTYYWHNNRERRVISEYACFFPDSRMGIILPYYLNDILDIHINQTKYLSKIIVTVCDLNDKQEIVKTYEVYEYDPRSIDVELYDKKYINKDWSGYMKIEFYNEDESLRLEYFTEVEGKI